MAPSGNYNCGLQIKDSLSLLVSHGDHEPRNSTVWFGSGLACIDAFGRGNQTIAGTDWCQEPCFPFVVAPTPSAPCGHRGRKGHGRGYCTGLRQ